MNIKSIFRNMNKVTKEQVVQFFDEMPFSSIKESIRDGVQVIRCVQENPTVVACLSVVEYMDNSWLEVDGKTVESGPAVFLTLHRRTGGRKSYSFGKDVYDQLVQCYEIKATNANIIAAGFEFK